MHALRVVVIVGLVGCGGRAAPPRSDAAVHDAGVLDAPVLSDAPAMDARPAVDAPTDGGTDARTVDVRVDAPIDAPATVDAQLPIDAPRDAPRPDAAACVLGEVGCTGGYTADTYVGSCSARELHVLGVYEPSSGRSNIPVSVTRTGAMLTLVFSSYEPVSWDVTLGPGVTVERVILNGFSPQAVTGLPASVTVTNRSGPGYIAACAYEWPVGTGGCATEDLVSGVMTLTGLATTSFTGCYQAATFTIADP